MEYFTYGIIILLGFVLTTIGAKKANCTKRVFYLILLLTVFKCLILIVNEFWGFMPVKPDSIFYYKEGVELYNTNSFKIFKSKINEVGGRSSIGIIFYLLLSNVVYYIFGAYELLMPYINIFLYSGLILYIYHYFSRHRYFYKQKHFFFTVFLLALYPWAFSVFMYNLRDPIGVFAYIILVILLIKFNNEAFRKPLFYFAILVFVVIRPIMIVSLLVLFMSYYYTFSNRIGIFHLFFSLSFLFGLGYILQSFLLPFIKSNLVLDIIQVSSENLRNTYPIEMKYSSFVQLIKSIPEKFYYFLFYPFPWSVDSLKFIMAYMDVCFHIFLGGCLLWNIQKVQIDKTTKFLLINIILGYLMLAIVETTFGGAMRHRLPFTLLLIITVSHLIYKKKRYRKVSVKKNKV